MLVLVPLVVTAALAAYQSEPQLPPGPLAFVIELDTTGGFTGRGRGGVTVDSGGTVRASRVGGSNRQASAQCRTRLTADQLESLQRAVAAARLQPWPETFAPEGDSGCCDRYRWTLRLAQRQPDDQVRTAATMWYDGNEGRLPKDVTVIRDIATAALTRSLAECDRR